MFAKRKTQLPLTFCTFLTFCPFLGAGARAQSHKIELAKNEVQKRVSLDAERRALSASHEKATNLAQTVSETLRVTQERLHLTEASLVQSQHETQQALEQSKVRSHCSSYFGLSSLVSFSQKLEADHAGLSLRTESYFHR